MIRIPANRPPTAPGEMLREEFLKPLRMTQTELARRIGIDRAHISELIRAKRPVTADIALRLERVFGMSAQFWLNLQMAWDLWHVLHSPTARSIAKIRRAPGSGTARRSA